MKKFLGFLLLTLTVVSCSAPDGIFRLTGKFKNFSQGELYIYAMNGKGKIDSIKLADSKFRYEIPMEDTVMLSIIFPNFSEIPIVAMPGTDVKMEGDASHLKEVAVKGTEENDQLTLFRMKANEQTPPEAAKTAEAFIKEHPASPACLYLVNKYFLLKADADLSKVQSLLTLMLKATPDNKQIQQIKKQTAMMHPLTKGHTLPKFSAVSIDGRHVSNEDLKGDVNIVCIWANWSYESLSIQRQLLELQKDYGKRLQIVGICMDANPEECRKTVERDSLRWPIMCDGAMWDMAVVRQLGIQAVPDNIITGKDGKIIASRLSAGELRLKIQELLNQTAKK